MAMSAQPGHEPGPEIVELGSVPGFLVFDMPGVPLSAGGTRLAPDLDAAEVALLARAMTYKYAALGWQVGGAKAGVRGDPADRAGKAALMARFCAEVGPLVSAGRFVTGPDMGTSEEDFAPLREDRPTPAALRSALGGVPFEDVLTGYGVAAAAEAALAAEWGWGWDNRSVAIEGFGKVGGGVATPPELPGIVLAALATLGFGAVLGPEAPLIALGGGVAGWAVSRIAKGDKRPCTREKLGDRSGCQHCIRIAFEDRLTGLGIDGQDSPSGLLVRRPFDDCFDLFC